jgi:hypothetical protein
MSAQRADHSPAPAQLVLGFGNTPRRAIAAGLALVGDLLGDGRYDRGQKTVVWPELATIFRGLGVPP